MIDVANSITINRPVEEVFAYVTDTANDPAWHTDILEARKTSDGPIGTGTTWHQRFKPFMGVSEGTAGITAFPPPWPGGRGTLRLKGGGLATRRRSAARVRRTPGVQRVVDHGPSRLASGTWAMSS